MKQEYDLQTFDNKIPQDLRDEVWKYIREQDWVIKWQPTAKYPGDLVHWNPLRDGNNGYRNKPDPAAETIRMPRTTFGVDETSLKQHGPIYKLWQAISKELGDKFVIEGDPEDVYDRITKPPLPVNPDLEPGWRVYTNGQPNEDFKYSHTIHRDSIDVTDESKFTLLYVANPVWLPSWMAECVYYSDDESTGDRQQWQKMYGQSRNFPVGWASKIVAPVPGRIILYDGRWLHTTRPASRWAPDMRIVVAFRLRKIS